MISKKNTTFFLLLFLFSQVSVAEAKTINTLDVVLSAKSASCINYKVIGLCFWLVCRPKCKIKTTVKVGHYNPDMVISAYNGINNNPWTEANAITSTASKSVLNMILSAVGGIGSDVEAGSNRGGTDQKEQELKFKAADGLGHPVASIPIGYRCPSQAKPFYPYFVSGVDALAWRLGIPEVIYPQALIPGLREVGHFPINTWGAIYPRSGFINQMSDPKTGAVIAQRVGDIVTRSGQPHVYSKLSGGGGGGMKVWNPPPLVETRSNTGKWQMLTPNMENSCSVFGTNDIASIAGWGGGKQAASRNYAWTLWRPYSCCKKKRGKFLFSTGSYP